MEIDSINMENFAKSTFYAVIFSLIGVAAFNCDIFYSDFLYDLIPSISTFSSNADISCISISVWTQIWLFMPIYYVAGVFFAIHSARPSRDVLGAHTIVFIFSFSVCWFGISFDNDGSQTRWDRVYLSGEFGVWFISSVFVLLHMMSFMEILNSIRWKLR